MATDREGREQFDHGIMRAQLERMYRQPFDQRLPIPEDLFRLANKDPLIRTFIDSWRHGHCSWEAALIGIIVHRQEQYDKLMENARVILDQSTQPFIIPRQEGTPARGEQEALQQIENSKWRVLARHGRTFVVEDTPGLACARWYDYIIVTVSHPKLGHLIQEGLKPL